MNFKNTVTVVFGLLIIVLLSLAFIHRASEDRHKEYANQVNIQNMFIDSENLNDRQFRNIGERLNDLSNRPVKVSIEDILKIKSEVKSELTNDLIAKLPSYEPTAYCLATELNNGNTMLECRDMKVFD